MSSLSRRRFLFGLAGRRNDAEARREESIGGARSGPSNGDGVDKDLEPEPPPMPQPGADGIAWQRQQGSTGAGRHGLPGAIAWLADYIDDHEAGAEPAEPELPAKAASAPVLRPPGAVAESRFLELCTRCGDCIEACPHAAIGKAPAVYRAAAGTPSIDPSAAPCRLCDDLPCVAACGTGALVEDGRRIGVAKIRELDCLNALGTLCSVCVEQCPVPGAISLKGGRPRIYEALCTGCGVCHFACPAPRNAVAILPIDSPPPRGAVGAAEPEAES